METTEKIVESYCRYIKNWFTIPNIKCNGQHEIDLLAVNVNDKSCIGRYHIECGVSISGAYSKLTANNFSIERFKERVHQAEQRRTIGYFIQKKFKCPQVIEKLNGFCFTENNYSYIIVSWGWTKDAEDKAKDNRIELWDFRGILKEIDESFKNQKTYFTDDTIRTIQLLSKCNG